jgi:DNA-binding NarL/FixJ family response regulator
MLVPNSGRISRRLVDGQGGALVHENILLIDDDPAEADAVRTALANSGKLSFEVLWVRRCSQGLDRLAAENKLREAHQTPGIAAILLDLYLRDSCGIETFNRLFRAAPRIPILVLAAAQDEHVARAAVEHGAQDYLLKSIFSRYLLPQAVRSMVERSGHPRLHG